jgi:hypothetical protein
VAVRIQAPLTRMEEWCRSHADLSTPELREAAIEQFADDPEVVNYCIGFRAEMVRSSLGTDDRERTQRLFRSVLQSQAPVRYEELLSFAVNWTENVNGRQISVLECRRPQLLRSLESRQRDIEGRIRHVNTLARLIGLLPNDTTTLGDYLNRSKKAQKSFADILAEYVGAPQGEKS